MHAEAWLLGPCRKAAAEAALDARNARYRSPGASRDKEESSDEDEDTGECRQPAFTACTYVAHVHL